MAVTFRLAKDVSEAFPETEIRFVVASGLRNDQSWPDLEARLSELEDSVVTARWRPLDESSPAIASWHDAFRRFGTNPRRFRSSVDALSRRLAKNGALPRINAAVDSYNLVSVRYGTPAGAFTLSRLTGEVEIRFARPDDTFTPLGEPETAEHPRDGEVVYAGGGQVLTRHWNHRDCDQTKVTVDSREVVFIVERVSADAVPSQVMVEAQETLAGLVRPHAAAVTLATIDINSPAAEVGTD